MKLFSTTPNNTALAASRTRAVLRPSLLYLALAISAVAHVVVYWVTPHFINGWNEPIPSRFDAVIVTGSSEITPPLPAESIPSKTIPTPPAQTSRSRKPTSKTAAPPPKLADRLLPPTLADTLPQRRNPNEIDALDNPELAAAQAEAIAAAPIEPIPEPVQTSASGSSAATKATHATSPPANDINRQEPIVTAAAGAARSSLPSSPPSPRLGSSPSDVAGPNFPGSINIDYKMTSSVANGVANLAWKRRGSEYEIDTSIQATGFFTSMFVGVFRQTSRGEVTREGVRPNFFSLTRGDASADTAEFKRATKELKIIKHGETHLMPLPERMQDMQSFLFQMAHDAALLKPGQDVIDVQVTNARKVYQYKFKRIGEEIVQTRLGPLLAIHLKSEAADPEDVYEVWLAPQYFYMPVKLKFYMGRFPIEQVASNVRVSEPEKNTVETGVRQ